jgi:hypothetical protein
VHLHLYQSLSGLWNALPAPSYFSQKIKEVCLHKDLKIFISTRVCLGHKHMEARAILYLALVLLSWRKMNDNF